MAVMFTANVYKINAYAQTKPLAFAFAPSNVKFRPIETVETVNGVTLNAIIEENAHGLQVGNTQYAVAQTVAQLVTLATA